MNSRVTSQSPYTASVKISEPLAIGWRNRTALLSDGSPSPTSFFGSAGSILVSPTTTQVLLRFGSLSFHPERSLVISDFPPSAESAANELDANRPKATTSARMVLFCIGEIGRA